jgi:SAM-dependent methyltransferase
MNGSAPGLEARIDTEAQSSAADRKASDAVLAALSARGAHAARLLVIASADQPLLSAANGRGATVACRMDVADLERTPPSGPFDAAVVFQLDKASNPVTALEAVHRVLAPDGILIVVTPSLDSLRARVLRSQWSDWRADSRWYFDMQTAQSILLRAGFAEIEWARAALPASARVISARRVEPPPRPVLSIVMPVYNERTTFERTLLAVLAKTCAGIDKEVIIVESGSTDGTRELVQKYRTHPCVTLILQDRPRGKGAAVREGLAHARGTVVMIQDADDEYDVNDYDALLEPIVSYQRAFVLGSRHIGSWKVRHFADQVAVSWYMNIGHVFFTTLFNVTYGTRLRDPFTMYKVFRRDCLHGLQFEANRFDFDWELVGKLVRAGYRPLEVPVNYRSRSFHEGKKVSLIRDPLTWIRACFKYRLQPLGKTPR